MSSSKPSSKATPQAGMGNQLPKKELDQFRNLVKFYETKQYKKALKAAENVLKKYNDHGETLAMKGLVLNAMPGKSKEEAKEFVKLGLRKDMRSHVCWHVYGLLHRAERNYNEAIKAYKQALRIDADNLQILRDLSLLQVQMRDLPGFEVTRQNILNLKSNQKINWLAFAVSKHLNGDREGAIKVIKVYLESLHPESSEKRKKCFETSELLMYLNSVMSEIPDNDENVLEHLEEIKDLIVDKMSWSYEKGVALLRIGDYESSRNVFETLLKNGDSENYRTHSGYMCAILKVDRVTIEESLKLKGTDTIATMFVLTPSQIETLTQNYCGALSEYLPKSYAVRRIPLTFLEGEALKGALDKYCRRDIRKGTPFLGQDIATLFFKEEEFAPDSPPRKIIARDPVDVQENKTYQIVFGLVNEFVTSLSASNPHFPNSDEEESTSSLLWCLYLKAQLLEFSGDLTNAKNMIEKCIEHTPTCIDILEKKAHLLQMSGDLKAAIETIDHARTFDEKDRYINNVTTKYLLLGNREKDALDCISKFTRHEGDPSQNLHDMQCIWYALDLAACLARQRKWGLSLKTYAAVEKHFEDFHEDQFDFHSYCIRKVTLRAYIKVLRFEDSLWGQVPYCTAAEGLLKIYIYLHDNPSELETSEPDYSKMTSAEKKKAKAIARKKKKAAEKKADTQKGNSGNGHKNGNKGLVKDDDPDGENLLKKDPLEESKRLVATLVKNARHRPSTWIWQYDVSCRRGKYLMALQALFKIKHLCSESSELLLRIVDFHLRILPLIAKGSIEDKLIADTLPSLTDNLSIENFVENACNRVKCNPKEDVSSRVAIAKVCLQMKIGSVASSLKFIIDGGYSCRGASFECFHTALEWMRSVGDEGKDAVKEWESVISNRFPIAPQY